MAKVNDFEIRVSTGGSPVWCYLYYNNKELLVMDARELELLETVAKLARKEANLVSSHMFGKPFEEY